MTSLLVWPRASVLEPTSSGPTVALATALAAGAFLGIGWGVIARIWMRFISTEPEFSWGGTAYIVLAPTVIGLLGGLAFVARRRGWRRARLVRGLGAASMILLGVAAGILMLPSLLFGTLAVSRTDWHPAARWLLALLAVAPMAFVIPEVFGDFGSLRAIVALLWYLALVWALILGLRVSLAPSSSPRGETG